MGHFNLSKNDKCPDEPASHLCPMARHDRRLGKVGEERQDSLEVLDLLLQLVVGVPFAELLRHLFALPCEAIDHLLHHLHLLRHVEPEEVPPVGLCSASESVGWQIFGKMLLVFGCIDSDFCK